MDATTVSEFTALIASQISGFTVAYKDESRLQRFIGWLSKPFNPGYMTSFVSTYGKTVYFPSRADFAMSPPRTLELLAHEFVHLCDERDKGLWGVLGYALPQAFSVPFFLAALVGMFFHLAWLWLLVPTAVLLAPWPSPWRTNWEGRGYTMSVAVLSWFGALNDESRASIAKEFYGSAYYFMCWSKAKAEGIVASAEARVNSGELITEEPYKTVHDFLVTKGVIAAS